jgi:hypothetical protein
MEVGVLVPVGLHEDAVDVVDVDGLVGGADGLDQAADAEVAGLAQDAVGGADDEVDGGLREGVVSESGAVEFAQNKIPHGIGAEAFGDDRVGDAALDVVIDAEVEVGEQAGPADEDEVVILGKILEEKPQLAEVGEVHEVGVVEDGGEALAGVIETEGLFDKLALALEGGAFEVDLEGLAEDFDGVGVGVQGAGDGGDKVLLFGEALQRLLDDGLAGAGDAEDEAQSSLLAMDLESVVNLLLKGQQFQGAEVEGVLGETVEGADHACSFRRKSPLATASRSRAAPMRWPLW